MALQNSPQLNEPRTPLEALRDLMDKAEKLAGYISGGAASNELEWAVGELIEALPYDKLSEVERLQEEAETTAYHQDRRAMHRRAV